MNSAYLSHVGDLAPLFSFVGWWFIPGHVSTLVLTIFYRIFPARRPIQPVSCLPDQAKATATSNGVTTKSDNKPIYNPIFELQNSDYQRKCRHHRSIAHGLVICVYLGYSLISAYRAQSGKNHYAILGIQPNSLVDESIATTGSPSASPSAASSSASNNAPVGGSVNDDTNLNSIKTWIIKGDLLDQAGLKSRWRKLARSFHPDKLTTPSYVVSESDLHLWKSSVESKFINMREAYETLSDSTKRWAYDRFGPTMSQWNKCVIPREYLLEGIKQSAPFYGFSSASLLLIGSLKKADAGTFWRWTLLLLVIEIELAILTSKSMSMGSIIISQIFPNRAQFELIELLRKFFIASSCVVTQLSRILYPIEDELKKKQSIDQMVEPLLGLVNQLEDYTALANVELIKLIFNDLHPILRNLSPDNNNGHHQPTSNEEPLDSIQNSESEDLRVQKVIAEVKEKMLDVRA